MLSLSYNTLVSGTLEIFFARLWRSRFTLPGNKEAEHGWRVAVPMASRGVSGLPIRCATGRLHHTQEECML